MRELLDQILARAEGNELALRLEDAARVAVRRFEAWLPAQKHLRQQALKHGLVAAEPRLEHGLAAGQSRQLVLQVADAGDRQDGIDVTRLQGKCRVS